MKLIIKIYLYPSIILSLLDSNIVLKTRCLSVTLFKVRLEILPSHYVSEISLFYSVTTIGSVDIT
jgi:hypothetical protein